MSVKAIMQKAAYNSLRIRIEDNNGRVYKGVADTYTKADDEENGIASITFDTDDGDGVGLFENEIKSIEII